MQYFARSGALVGFPELVRSYGEHPYRLMREVGLSPAVLKDTDLYIPYTSLAALLALAAERCCAPEFGARLGYRQGLEAVGALGSLMCMQSTIADAVRILLRNLAFHAHGVQIDVDISGPVLEMRMAFAFEARTDCHQLMALSLALLVSGTKQLNAGAPRPEEVELTARDNGNFEAYRAFLGPNLQFGGFENRVQFPASILNLPVLATNDVRQRISQQWQKSQPQLKVTGLRSQVDRTITALLPTAECSLDTVARVLGSHPRSLQNRLKSENTSFCERLRVNRQRLACQYLKNTDIDLSQLAMSLGYTDLAPFSRAFKTWKGCSPRAWRKQARSGSMDFEVPADPVNGRE
ncbi:helix-turn-helix domain-containing protein [Marinobacter sp. DY40_1A1]|uniref:helix-turn-helix domain-containing protein n=1 Tax=Marinobacter sp. DY40_1A1 TaxID=2583229 RepID=UPI00190888DA|nr:AraC family transcriptional regulator [Marinobacter sp. DY40_1A1]MBK1887804.1 AraC family transcriptional regulator ligand-binding domain-containing protein [Marinobacter sp. DY40_1A1]